MDYREKTLNLRIIYSINLKVNHLIQTELPSMTVKHGIIIAKC